MSHTTALLDRFIKAKNLTSDREAMKALGLTHGTGSHWRQERGHASPGVIAAMCKATGDDDAQLQVQIALERAKDQAEKRAWARVLERIKPAAAALPLPFIALFMHRLEALAMYIMSNLAQKLARFFILFFAHLFHATSRTHGRRATFQHTLAHRKRALSGRIQQQAPMRAAPALATRARFGRVRQRPKTSQLQRTRHAMLFCDSLPDPSR